MWLYQIRMDQPAIALAEIKELTGIKPKLIGDVALSPAYWKGIESRLAFTRSIHQLLFECSKKSLNSAMKKFNWQKIIKNDFFLRLHHAPNKAAPHLAGFIWHSLSNPRASSESKTQINLFFIQNQVFCTLKIAEITEHFELRRAHLRPAHHPTGMHPKLARAMINLTGIRKGKLYDPFCGAGGILIEAGMMGLKPVGYDNVPELVEKAKTNLKHYKIANAVIKLTDSKKIKSPFSYVATDLPYGRGTKKQPLLPLYTKFASILKRHLKRKAVVMYPHFLDFKRIAKKAGLKILHEFTLPVHQELKRKIVVVKA